MAKNKKELQAAVLSDLFAETTIQASQPEIEAQKLEKSEEKVIRISRYFKIDKDLSAFFDLFCKIYDLNKTSTGIDYVLRRFKEFMADEMAEKIREQSEQNIDYLLK